MTNYLKYVNLNKQDKLFFIRMLFSLLFISLILVFANSYSKDLVFCNNSTTLFTPNLSLIFFL
jgi:hypothetical protein